MHSADEPGSDEKGNKLSGVVHGPVVQARNIYGDVQFRVTKPGSAEMPVPAQLPPATAHFADRSAELERLQRVAEEYDPARRLAVAVVSGIGGSGKTSLAVRWLHLISERYEGGVLYADLHGQAPRIAAPPNEVLTGFLGALSTPPERIPLEVAEQAKLYRSLTSGRRMLVLLDNAATAAQVRALLPGPGPRPAAGTGGLSSLVVVTTRWRIVGLAMDGAHFIELGPLDDRSCADLLGRMLGTDRATAEAGEVRAIVRLCAGLPLALCLVGAQLASRTRWPVSRIATELAREKDRLSALSIAGDLTVRAAFDVSYQALSPTAARLYRLLSLTPTTDFSPGLAAATADLPPEQAAGSLDELASASLLMESGEQRFSFHDLVRLHAYEHAQADPESERIAALARAVDWYLAGAVAADLVINPRRWHLNPMYELARAEPPGFAGVPAALGWMESERPGLVAAVQAAHDSGMHERAWQLCEALWGLFTFHKYFGYWIQTHQLGVESAQACGNRRAEARMRVQLGLAYLNLGRHDQARAEFSLALALDREQGHLIGEATASDNLGLVDLSQGRPAEAIVSFLRAREIFSQIGVPRGVLGVLRHIGEAHRDAGKHTLAIEFLLEAREVAAALSDPYNEARCLTSLGQAYLKAGQYESAVPALDQALQIMVRLGARYEQARIRATIADAVLHLGRSGEAFEHLAEALAIYSAIGAPEADDIRSLFGELGWPQTGPGTGPS
jgi:tetratricopeptide (TPR) repeat protein